MHRERDRVQELDVLRFIAALSVALYHLTLWPPDGSTLARVATFGFLGVPLFFTISGFVILMTAEGRTATQFVNSRVARLYPTFWVSVLLTTGVLVALRDNPPSLAQLAANLTMLPREVFAESNIDGVYWSLVVEMKFYGLILLLILFRQSRYIEHWLAAWLVGAALALFDAAPHALRSLTLHPWGSLFIAGCYLYMMRTRGHSVRLLAMFCVAMCISIVCAVDYQYGYTHVYDVGTRVTVALLIVVLHLAFLTLAMRLWSLPPLRIWFWLGAITYPLYLLHARAGKAIWNQLPGDEWLRVWAVLVLAVLASIAVALTVERRACGAFGRMLDAAAVRIRARLEVWRARYAASPR